MSDIFTGAFSPSAGLSASDSVMGEILGLPSLVMAFEFDTAFGAKLISGAVNEVDSTKPSSFNLFQPTAGSRPTIATSGFINGLPYAQFDGNDDQLVLSGNYDLSQPHSIVILFRTDTPGTAQTVFGSFVDSAHNEFISLDGAGHISCEIGNRAFAAPLLGGFNFAAIGSDGAGLLRGFVNGYPFQAQSGGNNQAPNIPFVVGGLTTANGQPFKGQIATMLVFNVDIFGTAEPTALPLCRDLAAQDFGLSF